MRFNRSQPTRYWPARATSLLLVLEAGGLVAINLANLSRLEWSFVHLQTMTMTNNVPEVNVEAVSTALFFLPAAVLAALAAIGMLFIWRDRLVAGYACPRADIAYLSGSLFRAKTGYHLPDYVVRYSDGVQFELVRSASLHSRPVESHSSPEGRAGC